MALRTPILTKSPQTNHNVTDSGDSHIRKLQWKLRIVDILFYIYKFLDLLHI